MYCTKMDFSAKILTSNKKKNISLLFKQVFGQKIHSELSNHHAILFGYRWEEVLPTDEITIHYQLFPA